MNYDLIVEAEIELHDWCNLREADGPATNIPVAFRQLLAASNPEVAAKIYWQLENHVVVQGALFEAALPTVQLIGAALANPERPKWVRIQLLELLFQIVHGESHTEEIRLGVGNLGPACRAEAQKLQWLLYGIFQHGELWSSAREIIECIDECSARIKGLDALNQKVGRLDIPQQLRT